MTVVNALTIDVEDYFHIHAFSDVIRPEDWDSFEPRVEQNTYRLLDLLDSVKLQNPESRIQNPESRRTRATFFVLGWVAERYPTLVKEIHDRGHEVACHGYSHRHIIYQTRKEFEEDVRKAKSVLQDLIGAEVVGYRAPTYSITKKTIWALSILYELGFRYDSSIFPITHDHYGFPEAPRFPFYLDFANGDIPSQLKNPKYLHNADDPRKTTYKESNNPMPHVHPVKFAKGDHFTGAPCPMPSDCFIEFPISTISVLGRNLPCSGGGYFRLLPYWYTRWGLSGNNRNDSGFAIFYIHPWEIDPDIPKISNASWLSKFRTYVNLKKTEAKLTRLLGDFHFSPLRGLIQ